MNTQLNQRKADREHRRDIALPRKSSFEIDFFVKKKI